MQDELLTVQRRSRIYFNQRYFDYPISLSNVLQQAGPAYGLMTIIQNFGLAAFPYFSGQLRDATHGYTASQIMFAGLGTIGLVFAILLWRADRREGGALERGKLDGAG